MKRCNKCGEWKSYDAFHKLARASDNAMGICKQCNIEKVKAWQKKQKGEVQAERRLYRVD